MSKGMYCSASQWMDSASSSGVIWGRLIFLTITALPDTLVATSFVLIFWAVKRRWMASMTAPESMIAPSTMASGGSGSRPRFTSWYSFPVLPPGFSSTALIADDPMSTPTSPFFLPKSAKPASLFTDGGYPRSLVPDAETPENGPRKRNVRGDTDLQKIVKVLVEASRAVPLCQAKNEAPSSKSWRTLHSTAGVAPVGGSPRGPSENRGQRGSCRRSMVTDEPFLSVGPLTRLPPRGQVPGVFGEGYERVGRTEPDLDVRIVLGMDGVDEPDLRGHGRHEQRMGAHAVAAKPDSVQEGPLGHPR